jgi:hypothetical protein
MHSLETGKYIKHARSDVNPRLVLREIVEQNMKSDRTEHFRLFAEKLFDGINRSDLADEANDLLASVINSWFSHNYPSVLQDAEGRALAKLKQGNKRERERAVKIEAQKIAAKAARRNAKESVVSAVVAETNKKLAVTASGIRKVMLLDTIVLPNGKKLREATGDECGKAGGLLARISHEMHMRGVTNGLVGDTLTEKQIQKLLMEK